MKPTLVYINCECGFFFFILYHITILDNKNASVFYHNCIRVQDHVKHHENIDLIMSENRLHNIRLI